MKVFDQYMQEMGYLKLSTDGTIIDCNDNCLRFFYKEHNDIINKKFESALRWTMDGRSQLQIELEQILKYKAPIKNLVLDFYHNSAIAYIELYGIYIEDKQGDYVEFCIFNATERESNCPKRNRTDLKSGYIQELGGIGTAEVIDNGSIENMTLNIDRQWKEITGCDKDTISLIEYIKMVPQEFHQRFQEEVKKVEDGIDVFGFSHSFNNPQKGEIWIEAHGRALERSHGVTRSIVMIQDITFDKQRVDEIKSVKKKLERATELANIGYFEADLTTGKVFWDTICYKLHGYPSTTEITYKFFVESIVHPEDITDCIERFQKKLPLLRPFFMEYRCLDFDGNIRWIREKIEPIGDSSSNVTRIRGAKQDITREKLRQIELERYRTELELSNKKLEVMVTHDELTRIYNRRMFNDRFEYEWRRALRNKTLFSVAIADIDHFKEFNDLYGHLAGDICLSTIAEALERTITRSTDMVSRYGGEEFAFILPDTSEPERLLEKCRKNVEELAMSHQGTEQKIVTISIGCATQIPKKELKKSDLFKLADEQLYKAKSSGRNQVCYLHLKS